MRAYYSVISVKSRIAHLSRGIDRDPRDRPIDPAFLLFVFSSSGNSRTSEFHTAKGSILAREKQVLKSGKSCDRRNITKKERDKERQDSLS